MTTILETFIDNMFNQLPATEEMNKLKRNLSENMNDKYEAYLTSGKSENESIGLVISEFGSIDEILEAYNIDLKKVSIDELKKDEIDEIIDVYAKNSHKIGLGVAWIILAVGIFVGLYMTFETWEYIDVIGPVSLIAALIPSIALFVYTGIKLTPYSKRIKEVYTLTEINRQDIISRQKGFMTQYAVKMTLAVSMCLIGAACFAIGFTIEPNIYFLVTLGFLFIAVAVYIFISIGNVYGIYQVLIKTNKEVASSSEKTNKVMEIIAPIYWCTLVAAYLAMGFIWNLWHISWVLFPIGGVLFGGIAGVIEAVYKNKK